MNSFYVYKIDADIDGNVLSDEQIECQPSYCPMCGYHLTYKNGGVDFDACDTLVDRNGEPIKVGDYLYPAWLSSFQITRVMKVVFVGTDYFTFKYIHGMLFDPEIESHPNMYIHIKESF